MRRILYLLVALCAAFASYAQSDNVTGKITCDGKGVAGVIVSDGYAFTKTRTDGAYSFRSEKKNGYVFYTIPSGYMPTTSNNTDKVFPTFWKTLTKDTNTKETVDFTLKKVNNDRHVMFFFADPQLCDNNGVNWFKELFMPKIKADATACGSTPIYATGLGDLSWDYYWYQGIRFTLQSYKDLLVNQQFPMPHFNVIGNHDHDGATPGGLETTDFNAAGPFRKILGPNYYSYNIGKVHYISLDNIIYLNTGNPDAPGCVGSRNYTEALTQEQIDWLRKDLSYVSKDTPIFINVHCPIWSPNSAFLSREHLQNHTSAELCEALRPFREVHIMSGHTHINRHLLPSGYPNIHEHNVASTDGNLWNAKYWSGKVMSSDGTPGGYELFTIDGTDIKWEYRSIESDGDAQFRVLDMNKVKEAYQSEPYKTVYSLHKSKQSHTSDFLDFPDNSVLINVYNYDPSWKVEVWEDGTICSVERKLICDPTMMLAFEVPYYNSKKTISSWDGTSLTDHMFLVQCTTANKPVTVKVTDTFGNIYSRTINRPFAYNLSTLTASGEAKSKLAEPEAIPAPLVDVVWKDTPSKYLAKTVNGEAFRCYGNPNDGGVRDNPSDWVVNNGTESATNPVWVRNSVNGNDRWDERNQQWLGTTNGTKYAPYYVFYDIDDNLGKAFSSQFTLETVVSIDQFTNADGIHKFFSSQQGGGWALRYDTDNGLAFDYVTQNGSNFKVTNYKFEPGKFYHIVVTVDNRDVNHHIYNVYINGQVAATYNFRSGNFQAPDIGYVRRQKGMWFALGADPGENGDYPNVDAQCPTKATFAAAKIYGKALTPEQVTVLYKNENVQKFLVPQPLVDIDWVDTPEKYLSETVNKTNFRCYGDPNNGGVRDNTHSWITNTGSTSATHSLYCRNSDHAGVVFDERAQRYFGWTNETAYGVYYMFFDKNDAIGTAFQKKFTIETVVRMDSYMANENEQEAFSKFLSCQQDGGWALSNSDGLAFDYVPENGGAFMGTQKILETGRFYHIVVAVDNQNTHTYRIYVNGKFVCKTTLPVSAFKFPNIGSTRREKGMWFCLGGDPNGVDFPNTDTTNSSRTTFADFKIYGDALTEAQVAELYSKDEVRQLTEPAGYPENGLLLDVKFNADGKAVNAVTGESLKVAGSPTTQFNATLDRYEMVCNGNNRNFFYAPLNSLYTAGMSNGFTIEAYCKANSAKPSANMSPISMQQSGGAGFVMSPEGKIYFNCNTMSPTLDRKGNAIVETDNGALTTSYTHYLLVYDPEKGSSRIYINGVKVSEVQITYKDYFKFMRGCNEWLCIGGDTGWEVVANKTVCDIPFNGTIATARLWGRAMTDSEALNLSNQTAVKAVTVKVPVGGKAGVMLPFASVMPEGLAAYVVTGSDDASVQTVKYAVAGEIIPANTPLIMTGFEGTYTFTPVTGASLPAPAKNLLLGTIEGKAVRGNEAVVVAKNGDFQILYQETTIDAYTAYLPASMVKNNQLSKCDLGYYGDLFMIGDIHNDVVSGQPNKSWDPSLNNPIRMIPDGKGNYRTAIYVPQQWVATGESVYFSFTSKHTRNWADAQNNMFAGIDNNTLVESGNTYVCAKTDGSRIKNYYIECKTSEAVGMYYVTVNVVDGTMTIVHDNSERSEHLGGLYVFHCNAAIDNSDVGWTLRDGSHYLAPTDEPGIFKAHAVPIPYEKANKKGYFTLGAVLKSDANWGLSADKIPTLGNFGVNDPDRTSYAYHLDESNHKVTLVRGSQHYLRDNSGYWDMTYNNNTGEFSMTPTTDFTGVDVYFYGKGNLVNKSAAADHRVKLYQEGNSGKYYGLVSVTAEDLADGFLFTTSNSDFDYDIDGGKIAGEGTLLPFEYDKVYPIHPASRLNNGTVRTDFSFKAPAAGNYYVVLDLKNSTIKFEKTPTILYMMRSPGNDDLVTDGWTWLMNGQQGVLKRVEGSDCDYVGLNFVQPAEMGRTNSYY